MQSPPYDLAPVRDRIPLLERFIPMNHCSQAPLSDPARAAGEAFLRSWDRDGMDWDRWLAEVEAARAAFAALLGASADRVAVLTSVSHATAAVASALDFRGPRDRIVLSGAEFPTVAQVWRAQERRGAEVVVAPEREGGVPAGAWEAFLDERTAVLSAAHGDYRTGALQDLGAMQGRARAVGALLYVDAYQTLGTGPLDAPALDLDLVASGTLKFLMGTPGIAFLYVRPGLAERLEPAVTGWFGRRDPFAFRPDLLDWAPGARRFDGGTPPILPAYVARAGMDFLAEVGLEAIGAWNRVLSGRLVRGGLERGLEPLGPGDPARKAPTTAFACPDADAVETALRERGILASARGPAIRLAPHFYTTLEEVDAALDALAEVLGERSRGPATGRSAGRAGSGAP